MTLSKIPPSSQLADKQVINVTGPNGVVSTYQYDAETKALYARDNQIIIPAFHGITHVSSDPIPNATTDTPGLESPDDKAKLDALTQTRLGVLGFQGSGFPDDGGFLQGDIILAAGTDFISIERVGNVIRFTVDLPTQLCACETCAQIFWVQDESAVNAIRPPSCSGKLPDVDVYGELNVYQLPSSTILDPANPVNTLNKKGSYPSLTFKRFQGVVPALAEFQAVLQRNNNGTTNVGWAMSPGSTGVPQMVWFMGQDNVGGPIKFQLLPNAEPDLLGALLYKGHSLTRQMGVVVSYPSDVLATNLYNVKFWDVLGAQPIGDEFQAKNVWKYYNPENAPDDVTAPRSLATDATKDLLPVGTLVKIWEFQIGEVNGERLVRRFFSQDPGLTAETLWSLSDAIRFGDIVTTRHEAHAGSTDRSSCEDNNSDIRLFERDQWGITGFEDPLLLADDGEGTDPMESNLFSGDVGSISPESDSFVKPNLTIELSESASNPSAGIIPYNAFAHKWLKFNTGALLGQVFEILHNTDNAITVFSDLPGVAVDDSFTVFGEVPTGQPSGYAYNNQYVADDDPTIPGLHVVQTDPYTQAERPVFLWNRKNHENTIITALVGMPDPANFDNFFPPIDILLRAPVDSFDDVYIKVIQRGQFTAGPYAGKYYVVVHGVRWRDLPQRGVLRTLTGLTRNEYWRFNVKMAFPPADDDAVLLVSEDDAPFLFDDDFGIGTGSVGPTPAPVTVPTTTTVAQLLHQDYTASAVRLQFSINDRTNSESVQLQVKAGLLDMCQPYELDRSGTAADDLVRGFRPGAFSVSKILTQQGFITSIETPPSNPAGFVVYKGGFLPTPIDGQTERWNELQLMYRGNQLWVWWNKMLITPDPILNAAMPTPVAVNTPYFPVDSLRPVGKVAFRLWPGTILRQVDVRDQLVQFNEFTNGQLKLA